MSQAEEKSYTKINNLIKGLLSGEKVLMNDFSGVSLDEFANHTDVFWDGLLEFMQNESQGDALGRYGLRDIDLTTNGLDADEIENYKQSVGAFINQNADLIDSFLDRCLAATDRQKHWNESFDQLLQIYLEYFVNGKEFDSTSIGLNEINSAHAGNSFDYLENTDKAPWVIPWKNLDEKNYGEIRDTDKIIRVLNDKSNLQITHLFEKYLRLLMPEYQRVVEIEDLNRNFWVIGQILSGVCSFLFNDNSPMNQLFNGILGELPQIWENLLYLWIVFATISQLNQYNTIQPIVIPLNNDVIRSYVKFDDFGKGIVDIDDTEMLKKCWTEHLQYLRYKYEESSLVIIPEIRLSQYLQNYYAKSYYPGVIVFNRKYRNGLELEEKNAFNSSIQLIDENEVQFFSFPEITFNNNKYKFIIDLYNNDNAAKIYENDIIVNGFARETPYYHFTNNFKSPQQSWINTELYFGSIRTIFSWTNSFENSFSIDEQGKIEKIELKTTFYDLAANLQQDGILGSYTFSLDSGNKMKRNSGTINNHINTNSEGRSSLITKGLYLGENPSWYNKGGE